MRCKGAAFILLILLFSILSTPLSAQVADSGKTNADNISLPAKAKDTTFNIGSVHTTGKYQVFGIITDKTTGETVPYAMVFMVGTGIGTTTDENGNFILGFDKMLKDSLRVSVIGYKPQVKPLDKNKTQQYLAFALEPLENALSEVVIKPGEDPAIELFRNMVRRKKINDPDRVANYRYESYNKLEVDVLDFTKKEFERLPVPMIKKFSFIYDIVDSSSEDRPFLPFFLTETLSDYYARKSPKKRREFIKASMVRGVNNESITKYLGTVYQNFNPYDEYLGVLQKRFVSPANSNGLLYYHYKIVDTIKVHGRNVIHMTYRPRRPEEFCFTGDIWIVDSVYALQRVDMAVPKSVNLNWTKRLNISQEFTPVNDTLWFLEKEKFIVEFQTPVDVKLPATIGRKTTSYKNIVVNDSQIEAVLDNKRYKTDVIIPDSARDVSNEVWAQLRHDTLNKNEQAIYYMIDTLTNLPSFKQFRTFMRTVIGGMVRLGYVEIGPYWRTYSNNIIEGNRFFFGMGNTQKLFKDIYLYGYAAYGTKDKRFKYNVDCLWLIDRLPRTSINFTYTHDLDFTDNSYDQNQVLGANNLLSFAVRKPNIPVKLAFANNAQLDFYREYYSGFSHRLFIYHKEFIPYAPLPQAGLFTDSHGGASPAAISTEIGLKLRYAYKERFVEGRYYRSSLGSKYPIGDITYTRGLKGVLNSGYDYHKIKATVAGTVKVPPLGKIYINLFGGKYFGTLPYPLLEVHPGNEYYYYNQFVFNMMNRYEFISDKYAGFIVEHSLGGGLFKYIPLLKKTKFRQFWTAKGVIGSLSDANKQLNLNKGYAFKTLESNPYIELGTGLENILKIFRVDFIWRVAPKPLPTEARLKHFGVFGSVSFSF